jgi:hypothetical protein
MRVGMRLVVVAVTIGAVGLTSAGQAAAATGRGAVTCRVSLSDGGGQGVGLSQLPKLSGTGRYVAFESQAANLVAGDTNGEFDVFLRDRLAHRTARVSVSTSGAQANGVSSVDDITPRRALRKLHLGGDQPGAGRHERGVRRVRARRPSRDDRARRDTDGGQFGGSSFSSAISADGRYVAFTDQHRVGQDRWGKDVYVRDRLGGKTSLVSVSTDGVRGDGLSFGPTISGDGRYIVYTSYADNLVPGDVGGFADVFLRDQVAGTTELLSTSATGEFGNAYSAGPTISADGRYVAFSSLATNLVPGDVNRSIDVFIKDRVTGRTDLVSRSSSGAPGDRGSGGSAISADGRFVAFASLATNLVPGDTNEDVDVSFATGAAARPCGPTSRPRERRPRFPVRSISVPTAIMSPSTRPILTSCPTTPMLPRTPLSAILAEQGSTALTERTGPNLGVASR